MPILGALYIIRLGAYRFVQHCAEGEGAPPAVANEAASIEDVRIYRTDEEFRVAALELQKAALKEQELVAV